ncbi:MAG: glycine cleavage system protein GcvH [Chitinispirillaceae bacterium]|nr:glycine cleavage system protein GcvH [Chitinispirillaceae bacterium]
MTTPTDRKYSKTHEWVIVEGSTATVGITAHAQEALGDITFVEQPRIGAQVKAGAPCGVIESVKAASDLYSPLSGRIESVNSDLESAPEKINSDPYGEGWIFKVSGVMDTETSDLLDAGAYDAFVSSEA